MRCFRVGSAFADFFRFAFPEAVALALRRFNCGFFFFIGIIAQLTIEQVPRNLGQRCGIGKLG
jgi:hypothetical protein